MIPRQTMLIELPIAVLKNSSNKDSAKQFIRSRRATPRRTSSRQYGFRPVIKSVAEEVRVEVPGAARASSRSTTRSIGGWRAADKKWFDPNKGLMAKIERAVGGPTSG